MQLEPILTVLPAIHAVGIEVRTNNALEMDSSKARIPSHWQRFFQEGTAGRIPNTIPHSVPLGIYTDYESDYRGTYSLIAGVETIDLHSIPNGMRGLTVPGGEYLIFSANGQMPRALIETWTFIWNYFSENSRYERTYTTDFERYENEKSVAIHIAVK